MRLTNDPAQAPTIFHYIPFLLSCISLLFSVVAVGINVWVCY